jgi:hypothetical protein
MTEGKKINIEVKSTKWELDKIENRQATKNMEVYQSNWEIGVFVIEWKKVVKCQVDVWSTWFGWKLKSRKLVPGTELYVKSDRNGMHMQGLVAKGVGYSIAP